MFVFNTLKLLLQALTAESSHKQIAWGIALGCLIGLVPKGNLLAILLLTMISTFRISLPALFFSTLICSWGAILLDPIADRVGELVLTQPHLVPFWTWLYDHPLVPWTHFNHTLVMGSFLLGLLGCYPVYFLSLKFVRRYEPSLTSLIARYQLARWLWGAEWVERVRSAL